MPAAIHQDRVPLKPFIHRVETPSYNQRTTDLWNDWVERLTQSTFLSLKYGLIDAGAMLDRMSKLKADWDSYGAEPPTRNAIQGSKKILDALAAKLILPSTIVASAEGGVSTYFIAGLRTAYVETYNDGSQVLVTYDHAGKTDVLEIGRELPVAEVGDRILSYLG